MRLLAIAAALGSMVGAAAAQDYPARPINIVVPAAAGGPTDTISRITAQAMSKFLGQQITIENAGGAGGTIGTGRVRARRARRLYAADLSRRPVDRRYPLSQASLRHAHGVRADRARHRCADDHHRPARPRAELARGTASLSEDAQADLRQCRSSARPRIFAACCSRRRRRRRSLRCRIAGPPR